MYQFTDRVRFSEMDENYRMRIPSVMRVMQDCSDYQSEALDVGHQYLKENGLAWILLFWQVFFERLPADRQEITVETRPWKFRHFYGHRNFAIYDASGERLVAANSLWGMVETDRMRPVKPPEKVLESYGTDEQLVMEYAASRKIALPEHLEAGEPFPVRRGNLDMNCHVNNVQYIDMACELLPEGFEVYELRAEYRKAARLGDIIVPYTAWDGEWFVAALCDTDGTPYAVVEMRERGEEHV